MAQMNGSSCFKASAMVCQSCWESSHTNSKPHNTEPMILTQVVIFFFDVERFSGEVTKMGSLSVNRLKCSFDFNIDNRFRIISKGVRIYPVLIMTNAGGKGEDWSFGEVNGKDNV